MLAMPGEWVVQFKYLSIPEYPLWVVSSHSLNVCNFFAI